MMKMNITKTVKRGMSLCLMGCFLAASPVAAATAGDKVEVPDNAADYQELENLKTEVAEAITSAYESELGPVSESDIKFSDYYKIYHDIDILSLGLKDQKEIMEALEDSVVSYEAYTEIDGRKVGVTFARGLEVTDAVKMASTPKQLQEAENNAGRLYVAAVGIIQDGDQAVDEALDDFGASAYDDVIVAASQKEFSMPVMIGFTDGKAEAVMPVYGGDYEVLESLEPVDGHYDYDAVIDNVTKKGAGLLAFLRKWFLK